MPDTLNINDLITELVQTEVAAQIGEVSPITELWLGAERLTSPLHTAHAAESNAAGYPTWDLGPAADNEAGGTFIVPVGWNTAQVRFWITNPSASSGDVGIRRRLGIDTADAALPTLAASSTVTTAMPAQNATKRVGSAAQFNITGLVAGTVIYVACRRVISGQTYTDQLGLLGIQINKLT